MNMNKQIINNYPRKNTDWQYINYLENVIRDLKEELRMEKEYSSKLYYDNLYLKHQKIPQLEGTIKYYKQSLL